jgi:hypothetical protein
VLYQLSYAPRLRRGLYRRLVGITSPVSTIEEDRPDDDDSLLEEQEGKGYGEDEGEREQSLDDLPDADEQ